MKQVATKLTMVLVVVIGLSLLYNAVMNPGLSEDASCWGGVAGLFTIIFGTIWLHED